MNVLGSSAVIRHSIAWPLKDDVVLRIAERGAGGDADLLAHQVDVAEHFGHRMLHLQPGVHLDERELPVLIEEFQRPGVAVSQFAQRRGRGLDPTRRAERR